jgi:hypothetical protein
MSLVMSAGIAQLVERNLAKVEVAGSNPVSRSNPPSRLGGRVVMQRTATPCTAVRFRSEPPEADALKPIISKGFRQSNLTNST